MKASLLLPDDEPGLSGKPRQQPAKILESQRALPVPEEMNDSVAASLLLAYGMYFPERPIYMYFVFPIPAKIFVIIMGVLWWRAA